MSDCRVTCSRCHGPCFADETPRIDGRWVCDRCINTVTCARCDQPTTKSTAVKLNDLTFLCPSCARTVTHQFEDGVDLRVAM